jgi:peptidoglycan/LPS O-acetylase OafA/YrhL
MNTRQGEIASLTGLRGLAALLVVITHYWGWARVTPTAALPPSIGAWMQTSDIGMAIFFTLSGYVIALSYSDWDWRARPAFNLIRLFFYRFARLYPAFFLFAVLIVLRNPPLRDLADPQTERYLWPHLLLWHTWWPVKYDGMVAVEDRFNVSWSLSTECALYLLFGIGAILVAMLPKFRFRPLILGVMFFVGTWELIGWAWSARAQLAPAGWDDWDWGRWLFYISPVTVALQFGVGVAAYRLSHVALPSWVTKVASDLGAVALLVIYVGIANGAFRDKLDQALFSSLATGILMIGATSDSVANRLLSGRGIVYLGTISYSVYLFHAFVPALAFNGEVPDFDLAAAAYHAVNGAISFALTIMLASGIHKFVEVPGRRAIRTAADRLLGIQRVAPIAHQGAPAE